MPLTHARHRMSDLPSTKAEEASISGRTVVFAMFALGIVATVILWIYWTLHLQPFMPLQEAISGNFENSSPRVDGGQRKSHKGTPRVLRIVMRVPFNPNAAENSAEVTARIEKMHAEIRELAQEHVENFAEYQLLSLFLYHELPENRLEQLAIHRSLPDWKLVEDDGQSPAALGDPPE